LNYNDKFPVISLRVDLVVKKKLASESGNKKITLNELCRSILEDYANKKLVSPKKSLDLEIAQARLEKLKVETKYLQLKNDYFENFKKPLSDSGTRILSRAVKHQKLVSPEDQHQSPYDESNKRFQCVDCGVLFAYGTMDGFLSQMLEYKNHILAKHNRELNPIEKDVFNKIQFQGVSK
jgi:hypothetical protein